MTKSKYTQHAERNTILREYYEHLMPRYEKQVISDNMTRLINTTREQDKKAKIGKVGALEIMYELGRFLNSLDE